MPRKKSYSPTKLEFFILTDENEDGQLTLSIRRIEYMRAWERVRQLPKTPPCALASLPPIVVER